MTLSLQAFGGGTSDLIFDPSNGGALSPNAPYTIIDAATMLPATEVHDESGAIVTQLLSDADGRYAGSAMLEGAQFYIRTVGASGKTYDWGPLVSTKAIADVVEMGPQLNDIAASAAASAFSAKQAQAAAEAVQTGATNTDASKLTSGTLAAARLPDLSGTYLPTSEYVPTPPTTDASALTSGTLPLARVPSLPASQTTSGTFAAARIPDLSGTYATTGSLGGVAADVAALKSAGMNVEDLPATGIVSAHRGGGATDSPACPVAPEGSIAGMFTALGMGAHIIDMDYRRTADGSMVVMHDTTVDRTTNGSGLVSDHLPNALPNVAPSKYIGTGWPDERVPTIREVLAQLGGKAVLTIEAKAGVPDVKPLADLIKAMGLQNSVFINTNSVTVVTEIVNQGCLAHLWAWSNTALITPGIDAGASLIEVPYNATAAIVTQCQTAVNDSSKKLRWFIAGPISTRTQAKALTAGIMGHVTDALGMTNRATGDAPLVTTIKPSMLANKRGIGWKVNGPVLFQSQGIVSKSSASAIESSVYVGDMSGTMPATYTLRFKFVPSATLVTTAASMRARVAATTADADALDATTDGYVCALRGNGQLAMWVSNGSFGAGVSLGATTTEPALVAGTEYSVRVDVTATTIKLTREDTGTSIGPFTNSAFRGGNHYLWASGAQTADSRFTDFTRS